MNLSGKNEPLGWGEKFFPSPWVERIFRSVYIIPLKKSTYVLIHDLNVKLPGIT
jgi:hypothetical protein